MPWSVGVVGGLQALLDAADPGKGFLQALGEFLLSHDQHFSACELEVPQSLAGSPKSRKPSVPAPRKYVTPLLYNVRVNQANNQSATATLGPAGQPAHTETQHSLHSLWWLYVF